MTLPTTRPGELGLAVADAVRVVSSRARGADGVAVWAEGESPLAWGALADAGWDLVGIVEDQDSATLRDLTALAYTWGENLLPLPLMPSIVVKRHNATAAAWEGPVTLSVPYGASAPGAGIVPFGQFLGIGVLVDVDGDVIVKPDGPAVDFDPLSRSTASPFRTSLTPGLAREFIVLAAAEVAGTAKAVVRDAVNFTAEREQFGRPVGSFQAVKHHLANAHIATQLAETAVIWGSLDEENAVRAAIHSFSDSVRAIELAIQVHGGLGFTWEMGIHFYLRHATFLRDLSAGVAPHA